MHSVIIKGFFLNKACTAMLIRRVLPFTGYTLRQTRRTNTQPAYNYHRPFLMVNLYRMSKENPIVSLTYIFSSHYNMSPFRTDIVE